MDSQDPAEWNQASYKIDFAALLDGCPESEIQARMDFAASLLHHIYLWIVSTSGWDIEIIGLRTCAMLYVMRPEMLDGATLEAIANKAGLTKQAVDKHVTSFRDQFGVKTHNMRSDRTRQVYKAKTHLQHKRKQQSNQPKTNTSICLKHQKNPPSPFSYQAISMSSFPR